MPPTDEDQATYGDPEDESGAGSQPASADDEGTGDENPSTTPTEAYKGLQRRLSAKDRELQKLNARLQELESSPNDVVDPEQEAITIALIGRLKELDPSQGPTIENSYQQWRVNRERQQLKVERESQQKVVKAATMDQELLDELRSVANLAGIDPDDDSIDYGNDDEPFTTRLKRVREQAKANAQPVQRAPVARPNPADGTAPVMNQGTPPSAQRRSGGPITGEMVSAATRAYALKPTPDNMAKVKDLQKKYDEQELRNLR